MRRWDVFALGRMRHLDLLALWMLLHPDNHEAGAAAMARASREYLIAAILEHPA